MALHSACCSARKLHCCAAKQKGSIFFPGLQVIERGFQNLKEQVTTFTSTSLTPDELLSDLELTAAWSTMIEVFIALKGKLCTSNLQPLELVQMLAAYLSVVRSMIE